MDYNSVGIRHAIITDIYKFVPAFSTNSVAIHDRWILVINFIIFYFILNSIFLFFPSPSSKVNKPPCQQLHPSYEISSFLLTKHNWTGKTAVTWDDCSHSYLSLCLSLGKVRSACKIVSYIYNKQSVWLATSDTSIPLPLLLQMPLSQISLLSVLKGCYQNVDANRMLSGKEASYAFLYSPASKRNTSISAEIRKGVIFKRTRSNLYIRMCKHVSCGSEAGGGASREHWKAYTVFRSKPYIQRPFRGFRRRWDNIKMVLKETGWKGVYKIHLVQYTEPWRALVNFGFRKCEELV
jgi:hypothetical protein